MRLEYECSRKNVEFHKVKYNIRKSATSAVQENWRSKRENIGEMENSWVGYADDIELFFNEIPQLQKALSILDDVFTRFSLSINAKKTKTMIINSSISKDQYPVSIVSLNGEQVENIRQFRYLGCDIDESRPMTGDCEVLHRISVAQSTFAQYKCMFRNSKIKLKIRIKLLTALVRTKMTYGCQVWSLTGSQSSKIDAAFRQLLRKCVRNGLARNSQSQNTENRFKYRINNVKLLKICKIENISAYVATQQKKYLAHIVRKPDTSSLKRLTFNNDRNCKRGRPQNNECSR